MEVWLLIVIIAALVVTTLVLEHALAAERQRVRSLRNEVEMYRSVCRMTSRVTPPRGRYTHERGYEDTE